MTSTMIPSIIWPSTIQQEIETHMQKFLCVRCVKETPEGQDVPSTHEIIFWNGSTYCVSHVRETPG